MGGLVTLAAPQDLPEGASPRNWDVDFLVGSVFTRPGLASVYTYATTLTITGYTLTYGTATFTYVGTEPTINEGFFLSGFTGSLSYLNGLEVFVESVTLTTFTAAVSHGDDGPITGLSASAVSTTGVFAGPNLGTLATSSAWSNPNGVFSSTTYASVVTGAITTDVGTPTSATNGSGTAWSNPANAITTGSSFATVSLTSASSANLLVNNSSFGVPTGATITGIGVSVKAGYTGTGTVSLNLQMQDAGVLLGSSVPVPIAAATSTYTKGSSSYLWGTTFSTSQLNSGFFGVAVQAVVSGGTATVSVNSVVVTVYYQTSTSSGTLLDQQFSFSISLSSGISGFGLTFKAYSSAATSVTMQLLAAGVPVGTPKTQVLNTVPTLYSLGGSNDPWGYVWSAANVNNTTFGVQITASGSGTTFVGDLDILTYITTALENFNYIGSFEQNNTKLLTFALDAGGNLWKEDVNSNPNVLSLALSGLIPGSFAKSATMNNQQFFMFSDLSIGTERPRLYTTDGSFYPVTQVGPGVAPKFSAATGSVGGILNLTQYSWATGEASFTFQTASAAPSVGSLYTIAGTGTTLDGQVVIVLSAPAPTTTTFSAKVIGTFPAGPTTIGGTASPQFFYAISSITQYPQYAGIQPPATGMAFLLSAGPGQTAPGNTVTVYYNNYPAYGADPQLVKDFNSGNAVFVYISNASSGSYDYNGVWQVTGVGQGVPPGHDTTHTYFTFTYTTSGSNQQGIPNSVYRETLATMTVATPIAGLTAGTQVTITGATPSGWNNSWIIVGSVNNGQYTITSTQYNGAGVATYGWQFASLTNSQAPIVGSLITITGCTNDAGFNGTFLIASVSGSTFTVNVTINLAAQSSPITEGTAQAIMFGTVFTFDPGETYVGTNTNVIYGNDSGTGQIAVLGSSGSVVPIGAGTRQAVVFFITASGNWTPVSPPITFTTSTDANLLNVTSIPIGPSNVVGRGIAITEAGQNGVPGANFYVIEQPVVNTAGGVTVTYSSTIINDNTSTSAAFSFTDAVLLNSTEIDIPGFNQFNLIELGSSAWCIPYANRMFYGLQLNKVDNFNNLTFDGGYVSPNQPAGWGLYPTANEISLISSPVTGSAYYVKNSTGSIQAQMGLISQTAYQDPYKVAIINANTAYSVRVACSCPSGVRLGTLVIDLTDLNNGNFGTTYGSFTVPLSSMGTNVAVFSGTLLNTGVFTGAVSSSLQLRVWVQNMGVGADVLIDRFEVYPTDFPYLRTEVYGSYINKPEAVDASADGGILDTSTENPQDCVGAFVLRDSLYLMKTNSLYVTKDNPNSEPGGWSISEISNRVGAVGINAYDTGDEWAVMACRSGIYGFTGGVPLRLTEEIFQVWEAINWNAGNTIVLRNDIINRRLLCAIPLPTGTNPTTGVQTASVQWLPYAPYNPAPTTPNVMLMLNYQALGTAEELFNSPQMHTTMFGTLAVQDMKRKWSIWNISTPFMDFVTRADLIDKPLYIGNGIASSKIYQLDPAQRSDDGTAIYSLYTTYGHVNAAKAVTMPIFGMHTKRYTVLQATIEGSGTATARILPNILSARYPYTVPVGLSLVSPAQDDYFRAINVKAQRAFLEFSTNAVGAWFQLHKSLLTGKADPWSSLNPTGGGNTGIF